MTQIEIMPKPVEGPEDPQNPWPEWPLTLKTTSSHEEGCTRRWNINTLEFLGENGKLTGVKVQEIDWMPNPEGGRPIMVEKGKPEIIKAELVLLARSIPTMCLSVAMPPTVPHWWYVRWQADDRQP